MAAGRDDQQRASGDALDAIESLERLVDEHTDLAELLDRTAVLRETSHRIREGTGLDLGYAAAVESPELVVIRGWAGANGSSLRNLEVPRGLGLGGKAFALDRPVWVPDYCSSAQITHDFDTVIRSEGIGAMIAVPMLYNGSVVGVAYAAQRGRAVFGDEMISQVAALARPGGRALHVAQRAAGQTRTAVAAERQRIAVALHDSVGALLFSIGAEVRDLQAETGASPEMIQKLRVVEARVAETAAAFRESLAVLDDIDPDQTLTATLRGDCEAFTRRTGVLARCVALTEIPAVDSARCAALVAVVRESLVNVEKHAGAASVFVSLVSSGGGVAVDVADDGLGWTDADRDRPVSEFCTNRAASDAGSGMGLKACYDRLARLGGSLSVVGNEDGGITVRSWVPLP